MSIHPGSYGGKLFKEGRKGKGRRRRSTAVCLVGSIDGPSPGPISFLASTLDLRAKPQIRIPGIHASASSAAAAGILVEGPEMKENAWEGALRPRGLWCTNKEIADSHYTPTVEELLTCDFSH